MKNAKTSNNEVIMELGALVNMYSVLKNVGTTPSIVTKLDSLIEKTLDKVQ